MAINSDDSSVSALTLRPFHPASDAPAFFAVASDPVTVSRAPSIWSTWTNESYALEFLNKVTVNHAYFRAICWNNNVIGFVSVGPAKPEDDFTYRAQAGFAVAREFRGRGVATAALKMAMQEVFSEWNVLERVEALVEVDNFASQRTLQKAGFIKEGVLRNYMIRFGVPIDMAIFSLLRNDFVQSCQGTSW